MKDRLGYCIMHAVCFEIGSGDIDSIIKEIKEKVKKIPKKGIGYGISKYLNENLYYV